MKPWINHQTSYTREFTKMPSKVRGVKCSGLTLRQTDTSDTCLEGQDGEHDLHTLRFGTVQDDSAQLRKNCVMAKRKLEVSFLQQAVLTGCQYLLACGTRLRVHEREKDHGSCSVLRVISEADGHLHPSQRH